VVKHWELDVARGNAESSACCRRDGIMSGMETILLEGTLSCKAMIETHPESSIQMRKREPGIFPGSSGKPGKPGSRLCPAAGKRLMSAAVRKVTEGCFWKQNRCRYLN
jgi:hypothetical protein